MPAEVKKTPTGFLHLRYELRLQIYHLTLPTRTVFDIMEKPTFFGRYYWFDFSSQDAWDSDSNDSRYHSADEDCHPEGDNADDGEVSVRGRK